MNRIKMAGGMLAGAVLLQLGFMACSASNTTGMMAGLFDGGTQGGDTGVMGGRDARAQEMPCTRWEVKEAPGSLRRGSEGPIAQQEEAGWEPFAVASDGAGTATPILRRCTAR